MNIINELASIAKSNCIDNSNSLRDSIVSEYTDTINSLETIDKSIIRKDIRQIPVYKISLVDEVFDGNAYMDYATKGTTSYALARYKNQYTPYSISFNLPSFINVKELEDMAFEKAESYYKFSPRDSNRDYPFKFYSLLGISSDKLMNYIFKNTKGLERISVKLYQHNFERKKKRISILIIATKDEIKSLYLIINENNLVSFNGNDTLYETTIEEGYAIDLDSLKYVVKSEEMTLEEAVQKIRDINYIGDTYPMYCVLKEGFNENMTVENFCTLYETLTEANIIPVCNNTISYNDFINEAFNKSPEKIKSKIEKYEKQRDEIKNKLEEFKKLTTEEQRKLMIDKSIKNILVGTLAGIVIPVIGSHVYIVYKTMKGDNTMSSRAAYVKNLNTLIAAYDVDIKRFKKELSDLEKDKK